MYINNNNYVHTLGAHRLVKLSNRINMHLVQRSVGEKNNVVVLFAWLLSCFALLSALRCSASLRLCYDCGYGCGSGCGCGCGWVWEAVGVAQRQQCPAIVLRRWRQRQRQRLQRRWRGYVCDRCRFRLSRPTTSRCDEVEWGVERNGAFGADRLLRHKTILLQEKAAAASLSDLCTRCHYHCVRECASTNVCVCLCCLFCCAPSSASLYSPVLQLVAKNMQGSKRKPVFQRSSTCWACCWVPVAAS